MWTSEEWASNDPRVEAMLHMGAAGVAESLLRTTARGTRLVGNPVALEAQVRCIARRPIQTATMRSVGSKGLQVYGCSL